MSKKRKIGFGLLALAGIFIIAGFIGIETQVSFPNLEFLRFIFESIKLIFTPPSLFFFLAFTGVLLFAVANDYFLKPNVQRQKPVIQSKHSINPMKPSQRRYSKYWKAIQGLEEMSTHAELINIIYNATGQKISDDTLTRVLKKYSPHYRKR